MAGHCRVFLTVFTRNGKIDKVVVDLKQGGAQDVGVMPFR